MHLNFRGVNYAFSWIVGEIHGGSLIVDVLPSRNVEVMQITEPVTVTYHNPTERVLFSPARDANPFFHLYESLWMLAGRNDVTPLSYYNSQIAQYSDDGKTFNGAYGYRWRNGWYYGRSWRDKPENGGIDQLKILIEHLKKDPYSRRAVLQMWTVEDDLLKIDSSHDVCCNTSIYFAIEHGVCSFCQGDTSHHCPKCGGFPHDVPRYLNMTVCNRSNDLIWGMLGANVVHFSILQEYVACCLGLDVGVYNQFTNNLHVYTERWEPEKWLASKGVTYDDVSRTVPLVSDPATLDKELPLFVERHSCSEPQDRPDVWREPFLMDVAKPMCHAFHAHKQRDYGLAMGWVDLVKADDWRIAAQQWIEKRRDAWNGATKKYEL